MKRIAGIFRRLIVIQRVFMLLLVALFPALSYGQSCTADFTAKPTSGCTPLQVEYTDASSGAAAWSWVFSGGIPSSATGKGPHKVIYNSPGTYDAALTINCKAGTDTEYKKGFINATACCTADFSATPTQACPGQEVTFTDASAGAVSWSWHFNGGTPNYIEGKGPHKVVYKAIGTYDVSLEIKCASSGDSEYKKALIKIVDCACKADFSASPTRGAAPLTAVFTDQSTNAVNWIWSFPGGTPSAMQGKGPHTIVYNAAGDYNVSLQINCANGQDLLQRQGYIHVDPVPLPGDYGDAPEGAIAYPATGVVGAFPTCRTYGPTGYIRHTGNKGSFLGNKVDHETDGNAGSCSSGSAYDQDELCYEADSGLWAPDAFTLQDSGGVVTVVPLCKEFAGTALGETCETAVWGRNINLYYNTDHVDGGAYINVLIDWNQDGAWGGASVCTATATPRSTDEHVLKNFPVPGGTAAHLSTMHPPDFLIGPNPGYVWARLTITETPVSLPWDGSGEFNEGESEDYLLKTVAKNRLFDFGDAPFHARLADGGAQHRMYQGVYLGSAIDAEQDGQPDNQALGDDRSGRDDEDGVEFLNDWSAGETAEVAVTCSAGGMLKAWVDFNQDKDWDDKGEMVLDTQVAAGKNTLHIIIPQDAKKDSTFARFRYSLQPIQGPGGLAMDGEVEDYRVFVRASYFDFCERDSLALVALYRSTNGDSWANRRNWLSGPLSTWYGVELDGCRVRAIRLPKNNLTGILPREIGDLDAMELLDLSTVTFADTFPNTISGNLPAELGACRAMQELDLSNNRFSGSIPATLGNLSQLAILKLQGNELTGAVPAELGRLSRLQNLSLNRNALAGEIPAALCGLADLRELYLSDNQLTGTIPDDIGRLSNLRLLVLGRNHLSGRLPASLYTLTNLTHLGLYDNGFEGALSAEIGRLVNLISLIVYENRFEGELPAELYTLTHLQQLRLNNNQFSGRILPAISSLHQLLYLNLENNQFSGSVPNDISRLVNLETISLHNNHFTYFPDISSLPALETLRLENNRLTFGDIEPNMSAAGHYYSYAPQDSLGIERDTTLTAGTPFELRHWVDGTGNAYQWQRNGVDVAGANTTTLHIAAVAAEHIGSYICRITNSIAVDLTLYTRPVHVFVSGVTVVPDPSSQQPDCFRLEQNHPNPFNPETQIEYQLPQSSPVRLGVYNLQGQCVRMLVNEIQDAGIKHVVWDARSDDGKKLSSGIYIYRLEAADYRAFKKMVLLQ